MTTSRVSPLTRSRLMTPALVVFSILSCTADPTDVPRSISAGEARAAKGGPGGGGGGGVTVSSTNPKFGDQGKTLNVQVLGSGFTSDVQATWLLHGLPDGHVHTNSTQFVSSTELIANITIDSDAQLAFWDVQVALAGGIKSGVGSEAFEVTSAQILGPGTLGGDAVTTGMTDQLQAVGNSGVGPWYYDDALQMVKIASSGNVRGIDPLGEVVVGQNGSALPAAWIRQPNSSFTTELLPRPSGSVGGMAWGSARTPDGTLIVSGEDDIPGKSRSTTATRPVFWRRDVNGTWSSPQFYTVPAGVTNVVARDVNRLEHAVGVIDNTVGGIVWDSPTSPVVLDAVATRINPSGTIIVGGRNNGPAVYWWRDPVTHAWHTTGVALPSVSGPSCISGLARDVNDAGVIVGWSCTPNGKKPTTWKLDVSNGVPVLVGGPLALPGLGIKSSDAQTPLSAVSVTETAPYVVAGGALTTGSITLAVRWRLP